MTKKKKDDEKCQKREERKIKYEAFMQKHKETLEFESVSSMELSDIEENEDVLEVRGGAFVHFHATKTLLWIEATFIDRF